MRYLFVVLVGMFAVACAAPATSTPTPNPTPTARPPVPATPTAATPASPPTATPSRSVPSTLAPTARPTVSGQIPIGTTTRLSAGISQVHAGVDVAAADEWYGFALANNQRAMREMIDQKSVFPIAEGTRLQVLQHESLYTLVKVLEGPQADRQGWIRATYIR